MSFDKEHDIGAYEIDEHEYPKELEKTGFHDVNVDFFTVVDYAPDNAFVPDDIAIEQINGHRIGVLASTQKALNIAPDALTKHEKSTLFDLINKRSDMRVKQYNDGEKLWDFTTSTILAVSGKK
ncbi:MAG TPA: hypothetical protein PK733_19065 [Clostridiales bacterium]|nr:hypothetical protein [Clostridiales bacterium]